MMFTKVQAQEIKAGHTYFMGSSSSPDLVLVLSVDEKRVRVVKPHGEMRAYGIDRAGVNIGISRGGRTMQEQVEYARKSGNSDYLERMQQSAALHGAPAKPRDFDLYSVSLRPVSGEWDGDTNWRAAEEYGNVGGHVATKLLDVDRVRGSELAKLMQDERFTVVKVELVQECPRA